MAFFVHRYLPKTWTDMFAFTFLLFAIHSIGFFEYLHVLPSVYHSASDTHHHNAFPGLYIHRFMGIFIYCNVMINLYKMITTNTSIKGKVLPSILKQGWRFCYCCECNVPPRSYHCHLCNTCILRRDHHCTFTGCCVGFSNQRYYLGLLFYMAIAGIYSCVLNIDFIYHLFGSISFKTILTIMFPMVSWVFVHSDAITGFQVFMTSLSLVGLFMSLGLLVYHLMNVYHGQCVNERTFGIYDYDLGWRENFKQVLGSEWRYSLFFPLVSSPLPSDGLEFVKRTDYENIKKL